MLKLVPSSTEMNSSVTLNTAQFQAGTGGLLGLLFPMHLVTLFLMHHAWPFSWECYRKKMPPYHLGLMTDSISIRMLYQCQVAAQYRSTSLSTYLFPIELTDTSALWFREYEILQFLRSMRSHQTGITSCIM